MLVFSLFDYHSIDHSSNKGLHVEPASNSKMPILFQVAELHILQQFRIGLQVFDTLWGLQKLLLVP